MTHDEKRSDGTANSLTDRNVLIAEPEVTTTCD